MQRTSQIFRKTLAAVLLLVPATAVSTRYLPAGNTFSLPFASALQVRLNGSQAKPAPAPARWRGLIGEYGPDSEIILILEQYGKLFALFKRTQFEPLEEMSTNNFKFFAGGLYSRQS